MFGTNGGRWLRVWGFVLATAPIGMGTAAAEGTDRLFARSPDHPLIESSQRISDGRKLQQDAEASLRRVDSGGGQVGTGTGVGAEAVAGNEDGSARGVAAAKGEGRAEPSAASADR